ncbi:hypothetical protein [Kaistia terrae]|uniref:Integrase n=1 Tax=Kaistia terrae TaxID=537017 RepID=A0ABW0PTH0_9HYPH|nr:hypothetical protein [Kaistia terrae]MCX5577229.1 hypothetical protein [Kaistia terrae]
MRGLFKRKGSDIWQGRFRIPENLWRERKRLVALGVKDAPKTQEHARSTGKLDQSEAREAFQAMLGAWDAKMAAWGRLLEEGPQGLSQKQQTALAADYARAFLAKHEDNPSDAPPPRPLREPPEVNNGAWKAAVKAMSPAVQKRLAADLKAFLSASDEERRLRLGIRIIKDHPAFAAFLAPDFASMLEAEHGAETDAALASRGLHIDSETRGLVNFEMARLMGAVHRGLEEMRGHEWNPVRELEVAPHVCCHA